jgi:hypothetical protein
MIQGKNQQQPSTSTFYATPTSQSERTELRSNAPKMAQFSRVGGYYSHMDI